jgi:hypothetical protein
VRASSNSSLRRLPHVRACSNPAGDRAAALVSFAVIGATGGKKNLEKIASGIDLGPGPPGVAEARELKARSAAKSKAKMKEVLSGGEE